MDDILFIGPGGGQGSLGGALISGTVAKWSDLPTSPSIGFYAGQLWRTTENDGGRWPALVGSWKYPANALYSPNADNTAWIQTPFNIHIAEDATTILNITDWTDFVSWVKDFAAGNRILYNNKIYVNISGAFTGTAPDTDTTNWKQPDLNARSLTFDINDIPTVTPEGTIWWNGKEHTLNVVTGLGPVLQMGQESLLLYYNDTGVEISNFSVLHLKGGALFDGMLYPTPELADASMWEKTQGTLSVATQDIPNGQLGFAVLYGRARGGDTSAFPAGSQLWLSDDGSGELTVTKPEFPSYAISMGGNFNQSAAPDGEVLVSVTRDVYDTFNDAWDGSVRETFDFRITSNGTLITGTLTNSDFPASDLTLLLSDGFYTLDVTTTPLTITLTPGTSTTPQMNYVYIDKATKAIAVSTTDFPVTEHCKIAKLALLDALSTQTNGALRNQNINDHIKSTDDNGHVLHIAERIRSLNADWANGVAPTLAGTPNDVYFSTTSGQVWQMHKQTFPAYNMALGDDIHVVNDPTTPYRTTTNLNDISEYSDGSSWNNEWSNIVLWGVSNKTGETSHIMVNLPSDGYNSEENAAADRNNYTNYSIPAEFKGVGFLIGRFTLRISGAIFTYNSGTGYLDLRGYVPSNTAGGGTGSSGVTEFTQLNDTPSTYLGQAGTFPKVNTGETALEFGQPSHSNLLDRLLAGAGVTYGHVSNSSPLQLPSLTTTERDAVPSPVSGMVIWNTTTTQAELYNGVSWAAL